VWVSVRPEKIQIAPGHNEIAEQQNCVTGIIWDIGYLGNMSLYKVRLASDFLMDVSVSNMSRRIDQSIRVNDRVTLSWAPDAGVVLVR
jgi:putrescine transport system ATP-binding protein